MNTDTELILKEIMTIQKDLSTNIQLTQDVKERVTDLQEDLEEHKASDVQEFKKLASDHAVLKEKQRTSTKLLVALPPLLTAAVGLIWWVVGK